MSGNKFTQKLEKSKSTSSRGAERPKIELHDLIAKPEINQMTLKGGPQRRLVCLPPERFAPDPGQPRKTFDPETLEELRASIEENNQLQPIYVGEANADGVHPIFVGERRWRAISASKVVNTVYAFVCDRRLTELEKLLIQIAENDHREDVNPLEHAEAIGRVAEELRKEGLDNVGIAKRLCISQSVLSKNLALLKVPDEVRELCVTGEIRDSETLYQLAQLHKKSPENVKGLVDQWRNGEVTNLRKGARELAEERKSAEGGDTKRVEKNKNSSLFDEASSPRKATASDVSISFDGNEVTLSVSVGKKVHVYRLNGANVSGLKKDIAKFWSDKND